VKTREHIRSIWSYIEKQIIDFGKATARDPNEKENFFARTHALELVFILLGVGVFFTFFVPTLSYQAHRWFSNTPSVIIHEARWHIWPDSGPQCGFNLSLDCLGHPKNSKLWSSPHLLSDSDNEARSKKLKGKKFWLGLEITPAEAAHAFAEHAAVFEIGFINGSYRIFNNGILGAEGTGAEYIPAFLHIPLDQLNRSEPIFIAIELDHNLNSRVPAWFGAQDANGLYTFNGANSVRGYWYFVIGYVQIGLASCASLLALIFASLWLSCRTKVEYFYFSAYLFVFFMILVLQSGPIKYGLNRDLWYPIDFWLRIAEGCAGCLLGAAFSRTKKRYFHSIIIFGIAIGTSVYLSAPHNVDINRLSFWLAKWFVPPMFTVGGVCCFVQAFYLRRERPKLINDEVLRVRIFRLFAFGLSLALLGSFYYAQASLLNSDSTALNLFLHRPSQFGILLLIGFYIFLDYQHREQIFSITQRSPFHHPLGKTAEPVFGFLLALDLKGSSSIMNYTAEHGLSVRATTVWNAQIGKLMHSHGGFKVADEGDGLKVFFQGPETQALLEKIAKSACDAVGYSRELEKTFKLNSMMPDDSSLCFRSGLVWGGINPIWKDFVGVKSPEWEDAPGFTTFKDVQRIMDCEKQLSSNNRSEFTLLILSSKIPAYCAANSRACRLQLKIKDLGDRELSYLPLTQVQEKKEAA
jgi:hypothetical protein